MVPALVGASPTIVLVGDETAPKYATSDVPTRLFAVHSTVYDTPFVKVEITIGLVEPSTETSGWVLCLAVQFV